MNTHTSRRARHELMREHHQDAVETAETEAAEGHHPDALDLADSIITTQQAEIDRIDELLSD